ncbi:MAG: hypothetical protein Q4G59_10970, partial [Planctomycetia bacterium]|nr:hypothetical protein [Planctomycetia bacterium]
MFSSGGRCEKNPVFGFSSVWSLFLYICGWKKDPFDVPPADSFTEVTASQVDEAFTRLAPHPRLLLTDKQLENARKKLANDPVWAKYFEAIQMRADDMIKLEPVKYKLTGVRLLSVSRTAILRLANWSFLYRMTKDAKYAARAEKEMLAIAAFEDWHPRHYLDTAEMTMAVAIGYDACFDALSPQSRETIRQAILEKGLNTSTEKQLGWMKNKAN